MKPHLKPRLLAIISLTALLSCRLSGFPLVDQNGQRIQSILLREQGSFLEFNIPQQVSLITSAREFTNPAIENSSYILRLSMTQPQSALYVDIFNNSRDRIDRKNIGLYHGTLFGQSILNFEFSVHSNGRSIRIISEADSTPLPRIHSLQVINEFSGIEIGEYNLTISENIDYRQVIQAPNSGNEETIILQEVLFNEAINSFAFPGSIGIMELQYQYDLSNEGHSHAHDIEHDLETSVARIEIFSDDLDVLRSWDIHLRPGRRSIYLYPDTIVGSPVGIRFVNNSTLGQFKALQSFRVDPSRAGSVGAHRLDSADSSIEALPIDLGLLMDYSPVFWRRDSFELFRWNLFPNVYIFDFANLAVQARFLKRLAFFVEKPGYVGRLVSNAELADLHGWNAHNYHPRDLAEFFNRAEELNFELNAEERELENILLGNGIIRRNTEEIYEEGRGQIISVTSQPGQSDATRRLLLTHESLHGIFYNSPDFRSISERLWNSLSENVQQYLRYYLEYINYDVTNDYLMVNEFQAYMLHQPLSELAWVVQDRMSERLIRWSPQLANFVDEVRSQAREELVSATELLEDFLWHTHRFRAGDLFCLVPR